MALSDPRFSKILATIGPASARRSVLAELHAVGVNAFRLNFSHGSHDDHAGVFRAIRAVEAETETPVCIVADMQGPKIRCGDIADGEMALRWGETVRIVEGVEPGGGDTLVVPHPELIDACAPGVVLKFDDGKLQVTVTDVVDGVVSARVDVPGTLKPRKGINVIGAVLPMSAMTDKDRADMDFALDQGADYIALSFVQTAQDVRDARAIIQAHPSKTAAGIIVKIEKPSAVDDLDDILALADAAMVARGDLGVELPLERVPIVQRRIIKTGRELGKPVIVATHMLESMIESPTPTRAEASDVATAIYQGADAVMLSAETAVGQHPATAVAIMDRIIRAVESDPEYWAYFRAQPLSESDTPEGAVARAVGDVARQLGVAAILGHTQSGSTVRRIARERAPAPIIGLTPLTGTASRLALCWGVAPVVTGDPTGFDDMLATTQELARDRLGLAAGDTILLSAGIPFGQPGTTNTLKVTVLD